MSHNIHMDFLLTADADADERAFEACIRRLSVGSSMTNSSSIGPSTPSSSISVSTSFSGDTVAPSLILSPEYQALAMEKSFSSGSLVNYGPHSAFINPDYSVLSSASVPQDYIRVSSAMESFPSSAAMSPLSMSSFYSSPASSFCSDGAFDEGHDAATIAVARAAMPGLLHNEDIDDHVNAIISPSYLAMLSPKTKAIANVRNVEKKIKTPVLHAVQNGVRKSGGGRRKKGEYIEYVPGQESKPHQCTAKGCNARFKRQEHLKRHERTHTGEKPFFCDMSPDCGRFFSRSDNLNQHRKTHLNYNPRGRNKFVGTMADISASNLPELAH
ncbi:hypothetical protein DRE_03461 [Drechslerella stenobrocha 248]|uniref:C2H2-type domain-containing protein n=1 Tax=Drechslerella stenobrocha 248 TaxID=1043628 RepID=W7I3V9_9PEZI|nr:hypothetical protein DRE_03461 [Drechslerella stenobrocha 248]